MYSNSSISNLKYFLKEMFQFNENDLDFGIYKIYNLKRKHIEGFIDGEGENDLTPTIDRILKEVNLENQKSDSIELYNFLKNLNKDDLLKEPEQNFIQLELFINTEQDNDKKTKLVETLNKLTKSGGLTDELKDKIYNHILGFFQMYYSNGDFGYNDRSRDIYKIPYEADYDGSDTMFHWKHKGSIYIKTGTSYNAIKFELNGKKIEYRLETNTDSENETFARNNNKDNQLKHYQFNRIEKVEDAYHVIFNLAEVSTSKVDIFKAIYKEVVSGVDISKYLEYTKDEKSHKVFIDLGKDFDKVQNGQIKGLSALRQTKEKIAKEVKNNFERGIKLFDETSKEFTDDTLKALYTLDKKLNSFFIGNDADYFIHENLHEFLTSEKQRFVKNYIFDDLESIYNGKIDNTTLLIAKAFDKVTSRIIEFLSSIEEFQKYLFTKKKKVVENEYCITLDNIDKKHYKNILENKLQLQEWKDLFDIDIKTIEDLKINPTLVIDTKFFKQENGMNPYKDSILAEINDLDQKTNGLLINSENYQALELMQTKFKGKIKTIYIDPPYNTGDDGFAYKDNFKHSSWSSFIENRVNKSKTLLSEKGSFFSQIDYKELKNLICINNEIFEAQNLVQFISVKTSSPAGFKTVNPGPIDVTEYILFYTKDKRQFEFKKGFVPVDYDSNYNLVITNINEEPNKWILDSIIDVFYKKNNLKNNSEAREKWGENWKIIRDSLIGVFALQNANIVVSKRDPHKPTDTIKNLLKESNKVDHVIEFKREGNNSLYLFKGGSLSFYSNKLKTIDGKITPTELLTDFWSDISWAGIANEGKVKLKNGKKPERLLQRILELSSNENEYVLDFFAGSGTTNGSSIKMKRKTIGIEMGAYFYSHTLTRIKNVLNGENTGISNSTGWKGGGIVKYQVLEQYEDVLDNLQVYKGELPKNLPLKYLYIPEINGLENNLDIFKPFTNKIKYGHPTQEGFIDLIETYNYIQGYFIKTIKTYTINSKYYKIVETINGVLVVWREIILDEDDTKSIIEIVNKYANIHTIEVNAEFATLSLDKNNHLKVGSENIELKIISKEVFNQ